MFPTLSTREVVTHSMTEVANSVIQELFLQDNLFNNLATLPIPILVYNDNFNVFYLPVEKHGFYGECLVHKT